MTGAVYVVVEAAGLDRASRQKKRSHSDQPPHQNDDSSDRRIRPHRAAPRLNARSHETGWEAVVRRRCVSPVISSIRRYVLRW